MDAEGWNNFKFAHDCIRGRMNGNKGVGMSEAALNRADAFEDALAELEDAFRHMHQAGDDGDTCALCGLDLRSDIHQRATQK